MLNYLFSHYGKKWWFWVVLFILISLVVAVSYIKAQRITRVVTDFSVYLFSGYYFTNDLPLYERYYETVPPFLYLPFTAIFFSLLNLAKPETSTFIFNLLNMGLLLLVISTIFDILKNQLKDPEKFILPLLFALLFSARYLWTNFDLGQINLLIVWFILLGFKFMMTEKNLQATLFFTLATAIKIFPVILLGWFLIRKFRLKNLIFSLLLFFLILLLPFPFRGYQQSLQDLNDFYLHVIQPNILHQEPFYRFTNQSISGALGRFLFPPAGENLHIFPALNIPIETGKIIILLVRILIALPLALYLFRQIRYRHSPSVIELSLVILFMHLISSVTWKNHLVTMMIILIPFFCLLFKQPKAAPRWFWILSLLLMIVLSLSGTSLVGYNFALIVGSFSIYSLLLLLLYIFYLYIELFIKNSNSPI